MDLLTTRNKDAQPTEAVPRVTEVVMPFHPVRSGPNAVADPAQTYTTVGGMPQPGAQSQEKKRRRTLKEWFRKYFCAGQTKPAHVVQKEPAPAGSSWFYAKFIHERPYWVTVALPLCIVHLSWLCYMISTNSWHVYTDEPTPGYHMALTMVCGAFVAGATSEGGGAVAYPVMTLLLNLSSSMGRDFSFMIQSIGMTAATFTVYYSEIQIEHVAVLWSGLGGLFGCVATLLWVEEHLPPTYVKLMFVSTWLAFAIGLFILNRAHKRLAYDTIVDPNTKAKAALFVTGIAGGFLSGVAGSGLDIATFSTLTLYFRLSEKTATPTSVVLMGMNTVVGFFTRWLIIDDIEPLTWNLWLSAAPVVVVMAPVGAFVSSFLHRQVLASFVYVTISASFITAMAVIPLDGPKAAAVIGCVLGGLLVFQTLSYLGRRRMMNHLPDNVVVIAPRGPDAGVEMLPAAEDADAALKPAAEQEVLAAVSTDGSQESPPLAAFSDDAQPGPWGALVETVDINIEV